MSALNETNEPLRIGAVNYLNTKPLVHGLAEDLPECALSFELPSQLAERLSAGELDVALAPCVELAKHPEWSIISTACIGCLGPVLSVQLLFRRPPAEVNTLALDEGSRTSVILSQILLHEACGVRPHLIPLPIQDDPLQVEADALLVIGDRAIDLDSDDFVERWDLGERWRDLTGLPFVFAMWMARPGAQAAYPGLGRVEQALDAARDRGEDALHEIAREQSPVMGLSEERILSYLRDNLNFYLGRPQRLGLAEFFRRAKALELIDQVPDFRFDDCTAN
ncbi:MAG: menaquinone biosynthesis protein [Lacipirellulaceae bacterium]